MTGWLWFFAGIYGMLGILRFAWAMRRKASWEENRAAQEAVRSASPAILLVVCVFEAFLWPVELAISYLVWRRRRR